MFKIVAIAFLLGGCAVMVGGSCCLPKQYECIVGVQNSTFRGGKLDVSTTGFMHSVDFVHKKVAYVGQDFKMVQDYNKMMQFVVSHGYCTPSKLTVPIRNCVPENATVVTLDMGGPKGITLDAYDVGTISPGPGLGQFKGSFAFNHDGCIPFSEILMTEGSIATVSFFNMTFGIKDPAVFDVPSPPCPKNDNDFVNLLQERTAPSWPMFPSFP